MRFFSFAVSSKNHLTYVKFQVQLFLSSLTTSLTRRFKSKRLKVKNAVVNDLELYDEYFINISFNEKLSRKFKKHDHELMNLIFFRTMSTQLERFIKLSKLLIDSALIEKSYSVFDFTFERFSALFNIELFTINKFSQSIAVSFQNSSIVKSFILFLKFTIDEFSQSVAVFF